MENVSTSKSTSSRDSWQLSTFKRRKNITTVDNNVEFTTQLLENVPPKMSIIIIEGNNQL